MNRYDFFAFIDCAVIFSAFTISIYHILIFTGRWKQKEERGNLYLSSFTFFLGCYIFMISLWGQKLFYVGYLIFPVLEGITLFLLLFSLSRLMDQIIGKRKNRLFEIIVFTLVGITLFFSFLPFREPDNFHLIYHYRKHWRFPLTLIYAAGVIGIFTQLIITIIKNKQYKKPEVILALAGLMLILFYLMTKRLLAIKNDSRFFYNPTVIIGTLMLAYGQARRFNRENRELRQLRNELEQEVVIRTKELQSAKDEMARLNEQKTKMFINLAHETRTPLTLIRFHLDKNRERWEKVPGFSPILRNINKLQRDMVNFLDGEKLMRGDILYNHNKIVNFSELIMEKQAFFKEFCQVKGLNLETNVTTKCYVKGDPFALDRILNNLLMNAVKFTPAGKITVSLTKKDNNLIFLLEDTGVGIDSEQQQNIFKPYVHATQKKDNIQGYGMGLYITESLVKELNGKLSLTSKKEEGSKFKIIFPAAKELPSSIPETTEKYDDLQPFFEAQTVIDITERAPKDSSESKTIPVILVVEDNIELLDILINELSKDYRIIAAENGEDALIKLESSSMPDLILSDIMMDKGDGFYLYQHLCEKQSYQAIPFIFLSAISEPSQKLKAFRSGVVEFIQKPFSMEELKARVAALIKLSSKKKKQALQEAIGVLNNCMENPISSPEEDRRQIFDQRCREMELSNRQKEIAAMVAKGLEHKEISANLNISRRTVIRHLQNIYEKLQVHNKVEMINRLYSQ